MIADAHRRFRWSLIILLLAILIELLPAAPKVMGA